NATSSNNSLLTAKSSGSPQPGSYSFIPVRTAQSQQLTSSLLASSEQTLNAGEVVIHTGGFLDESVSLDQLRGGQGVARGSIRISDRSGVSERIDLRFAQTASDVVAAINANDKLSVVASLEGDHFVLQDVSGSTAQELTVSEVGGGTTAADLGLGAISVAANTAHGSSVLSLSRSTALSTLRDGRGLDFPQSGTALQFDLQDGSTVNFSTELKSNSASLGQLLDEINAAGDGKISATIAADGQGLKIQDLTSGGAVLAISSPNGSLAEQLGLNQPPAGDAISGQALLAGLSDVLLSSLGGGQGIGPLGQLTITDRSGVSDTVDLSSARTLNDVIAGINGSTAGVKAQLNRTKTGIEILDTSGSTSQPLSIANADATQSASALQIEASVDGNSVDSGSLQKQFITRNTLLADWNQGKGVTLGSVRLTDSSGKSATLNWASQKPETAGEVIDSINKSGLKLQARLNESGDGILIVDTAGGSGELSVQDVGSGSTAKQLGIAGSGSSLTVEGQEATGIDGARTIRITTTSETTVAELAEQLNALDNQPLTASTLKVSGGSGVRLLLNSSSSGAAGRIAVGGSAGIGFSETAQARDALLAFGANESNGGVLVSSANNTFDGLVEDLQFTLVAPSQTPVTVTVSESTENVSKQITTFVDQFNKLKDKLDQVTAYDPTTQSVGVLFGKNSSLRVDLAYGRFFSSTIRGAGSIGSLGQLGISLNTSGKLEFDKTKFSDALAADPQAVRDFFTTEDTGFSARAKSLADSLAGVESGALLNNSNSLQAQIEQNGQRIASMDLRLDRQRERLLKQFYNMESAVSRLQSNLTALNQLQIIPPLGSS
ncbi:MAG: flagellar filament capping protein FliD, partial [Planctomycetales bacterium]|nr:flagellar filament capping protein FliD [Planctomycetales bacterium]